MARGPSVRSPDRGALVPAAVPTDVQVELIRPREKRAAVVILVTLALLCVTVATYLRPVQVSLWPAHGEQRFKTPHPPVAKVAYPTPARPVVLQTGNPNCPSTVPLDPGPDAEAEVRRTAVGLVPTIYTTTDLAGWFIASVHPALPDQGVGQIADGMCGAVVGERTWEVDLTFPSELPSASMSQGQLFLCRFRDGWDVWFRYH